MVQNTRRIFKVLRHSTVIPMVIIAARIETTANGDLLFKQERDMVVHAIAAGHWQYVWEVEETEEA